MVVAGSFQSFAWPPDKITAVFYSLKTATGACVSLSKLGFKEQHLQVQTFYLDAHEGKPTTMIVSR